MFDLSALPYNSENPTVISVFLVVLFSFILSTLIAFTYDKTTYKINRPLHFLQTLILISIVAATVMQAIGDSLARGLGMLGALAIIRFRTTLRDPRNMAFTFASLAVGIACGVGGFVISTVGTVMFCIVAFLLRFSPFSSPNNLVGKLRIQIAQHAAHSEVINQIIDNYCSAKRVVRKRIGIEGKLAGHSEYIFQVRLKKMEFAEELTRKLDNVAEIRKVDLEINDQIEQI